MSNHDTMGDPAELAALYVSGAMSVDEHAAFEAHLTQGCAQCQEELEALEAATAALASLAPAVEPPPHVRAALLNRVAAEQPARQQSHQHADPHADFDEVIVQAAINRQIARQQEVAATEARRSNATELPSTQFSATQLPTPSANGATEPRARREPGWFVSRARDDEFIPIGAQGISMRMLFVDPRRRAVTCIMRLEAGATLPAHVHQNSEEYLVLEGELRVGDQLLSAGDFQRTAPGFEQADQTSPHGCLLLLTSPFE